MLVRLLGCYVVIDFPADISSTHFADDANHVELYAAIALRSHAGTYSLVRIIRLTTARVAPTVDPISFVVDGAVAGLTQLRQAKTAYLRTGTSPSKVRGYLAVLLSSGECISFPFCSGQYAKNAAQKTRNIIMSMSSSGAASSSRNSPYLLLSLRPAASAADDSPGHPLPVAASSMCVLATQRGSNEHALAVASDSGLHIIPLLLSDIDAPTVHPDGKRVLFPFGALGGKFSSVASWAPVPASAYSDVADSPEADATLARRPWRTLLAYTRQGCHDIRSLCLQPPTRDCSNWTYESIGASDAPTIYHVVGRSDYFSRTVVGVGDEAVFVTPTGLSTVDASDGACPPGALVVASADAGRIAVISPAVSCAYISIAHTMDAARRGLCVPVRQRGIDASVFDADTDARELGGMVPEQRISRLQFASAKEECMRNLIHVGENEERSGYFSLQFRQSLRNRVLSLQHIISLLCTARLSALVHFVHGVSEMTRSIEHAFSSARAFGGAMPNVLAFLRALARANYIMAICGGHGVSGRIHDSISTMKRNSRVGNGYSVDSHVRPTIAGLVGEYASAKPLLVQFPLARKAMHSEQYTTFGRDVLALQGFVDMVALQVRQSDPRSINAKARAGTLPLHNRALLGETLVESALAVSNWIQHFDEEAAVAAAAEEAEAAAAEVAAQSAATESAIGACTSSDSDSEDGMGAPPVADASIGQGRRHRAAALRSAQLMSGHINPDADEAELADRPEGNLDGTRLIRREKRQNTRAQQAAQPLGAAILGVVQHGHGASEMQKAVSKTELFLPHYIAEYQDFAVQHGEKAAQKSKLPKIRRLLDDGIASATNALAEKPAEASDFESDNTAIRSLNEQRHARFTGWLEAIEDMATASMPTPLTQLEVRVARGGTEAKLCAVLDEHARSLKHAHPERFQSCG